MPSGKNFNAPAAIHPATAAAMNVKYENAALFPKNLIIAHYAIPSTPARLSGILKVTETLFITGP
jgi:hypothetical protein